MADVVLTQGQTSAGSKKRGKKESRKDSSTGHGSENGASLADQTVADGHDGEPLTNGTQEQASDSAYIKELQKLAFHSALCEQS